MDEFELGNHEFIELHNLLKVTGLCASGGEAKALIATGQVAVDGSGGAAQALQNTPGTDHRLRRARARRRLTVEAGERPPRPTLFF